MEPDAGASHQVDYEPVSVKTVLAEMKDTAELLIDLSYSAVLLGSPAVADEVLELEARMDVLQMQARMSLLLAARSAEDAEALAPVLGIIGAAEGISDAAGDIAKVTREEIGLPEAMRAALPEAVETVERARVAPDSPLVGRTLGERDLETDTGVRIIALRRGADGADGTAGSDRADGMEGADGIDDADGMDGTDGRDGADRAGSGRGDWLTNPDHATTFGAGDVVILRGPREGVSAVHEEVTGHAHEPFEAPEPADEDLVRAVDSIVLMKNMSELAVDLAYGSVLFDSADLAEEVLELEAEVDALQSRFEAWVLRAASRVADPVSLRGLVHLAAATERISDAALEISEGVLRGLGTHPVVAEAVLESDEVIVRLEVAPGSDLDGTSLGEGEVETETGMRVIGLRRTGGEAGGETDEWVVQPSGGTRLGASDVVLAKGTRSGAARLAELLGQPSPIDDA